MSATLTLYGSSVANGTLTTACTMSAATGGTETSKLTTITGTTNTYGEVTSQGLTVAAVTSIPATPTGNGWVYQPGAGRFATGNWSASITLATAGINGGDTWTLRFFKYSGGSYTSIGSIVANATTTAKTTYSFAATSMSAIAFIASDLLYTDLWFFDSTGVATENPTVYISTSATSGVANDMQITTATFTKRIAICDGYGGVF
jgi:hypothetical protein